MILKPLALQKFNLVSLKIEIKKLNIENEKENNRILYNRIPLFIPKIFQILFITQYYNKQIKYYSRLQNI